MPRRDVLQRTRLGDSSEMHRKNRERPRFETATRLLEIALNQTGAVSFQGRLYKSAAATYEKPELADVSVPNAESLFVEIYSPINGLGRRCE
jgi:hypothetical protein